LCCRCRSPRRDSNSWNRRSGRWIRQATGMAEQGALVTGSPRDALQITLDIGLGDREMPGHHLNAATDSLQPNRKLLNNEQQRILRRRVALRERLVRRRASPERTQPQQPPFRCFPGRGQVLPDPDEAWRLVQQIFDGESHFAGRALVAAHAALSAADPSGVAVIPKLLSKSLPSRWHDSQTAQAPVTNWPLSAIQPVTRGSWLSRPSSRQSFRWPGDRRNEVSASRLLS
jgi:hypothetical protein